MNADERGVTGTAHTPSGSARPITATASADWPRSLFLGVLIVLSLFTIGLGLWLWRAERQKFTAQSAPAAPRQMQPAPDFSLKTPEGSQVRLHDLRGKVVLLNFWATWCPPCLAEMPDLNVLHGEYGATHNFTVLGVDSEEGVAEVATFARKYGLSFPVVLDADGQVSSDLYRVRALPTSIIIDREGNIRDTWMGQISKDAMVARLKRVW